MSFESRALSDRERTSKNEISRDHEKSYQQMASNIVGSKIISKMEEALSANDCISDTLGLDPLPK